MQKANILLFLVERHKSQMVFELALYVKVEVNALTRES